MNAIKAIWRNGQIVTSENIDWPEGCEVFIEPVPSPSEKIGIDEAEWRDDAESLAEWDSWIKTLEPFEYTSEEEAAQARFEAEMTRYNIEAVRRQMAESVQ